jgi:integrase
MTQTIDGSAQRMDLDKLAQRVIRPAVEAIGLPWYGWHGFRRGVASNLYALGVDEKVVQRILRHAKPHVTRERYIKAFDPAVLEAMQRMQAVVTSLQNNGQQLASSRTEGTW